MKIGVSDTDVTVRPVARTRHGWVRGARQNEVQSFRGIPYGGPVSGSRRFRPPVRPAPWTHVRDATRFGPMAPQNGTADVQLWEDPRIGRYVTGGRAQELIEANVPEAEDCLVLNVLTPACTGPARAVMVFLHGGGMEACSGTEQSLSDRFVQEQDVVLVTVNHRLNAFGFLYLGGHSDTYPCGNVGMLDLVLALQWVRDNIESFGGDPGRVTIFGPSGGGVKVLTLLGMPAAAGLFHRAIVHSCGPPAPISAGAAAAMTDEFLSRLGITEIGPLNSLPVSTILGALKAGGRMRFSAVVDGVTIRSPIWRESMPPGAAAIPMIIGNCQDEMSFAADPRELEWDEVIPLLASRTGTAPGDLAPVVATFRATRPAAPARDVFIAVMSARMHALSDSIARLRADCTAPTYLYRFRLDSGIGDLKAFHTSEVPLCTRLVLQPAAEEVSLQLSAAWAGFARTGDPNHAGMPAWPRYDRRTPTTMVFDRESRAVANFARAEKEAMAAVTPWLHL